MQGFKSLHSISEIPNGLPQAFGNIFVVAFFLDAFGTKRETEADLEFESFSCPT